MVIMRARARIYMILLWRRQFHYRERSVGGHTLRNCLQFQQFRGVLGELNTGAALVVHRQRDLQGERLENSRRLRHCVQLF